MRNARVIHHVLTIRSRTDAALRHHAADNPNSLHACTTSAQAAGDALTELLASTWIVHPFHVHPSGFRFTVMVLNRRLHEMVAWLPKRSDEFVEAAKDALTRADLLLSLAEEFDFIEFPEEFVDDTAI